MIIRRTVWSSLHIWVCELVALIRTIQSTRLKTRSFTMLHPMFVAICYKLIMVDFIRRSLFWYWKKKKECNHKRQHVSMSWAIKCRMSHGKHINFRILKTIPFVRKPWNYFYFLKDLDKVEVGYWMKSRL
jgi:hypothetical protein